MNCLFDTSTERFYNDRYNIYLVLCSPFSQFKRELSILCSFCISFGHNVFSCGHAISQIHKIFFSLSSNVKSGLLDVVVFLKLNSKFQTSFACSFSRAYPLHHLCLYHFMSFSTKLNSFANEIANIINALLCLVTCSRGGSRTAATSKMERFVIIVNG